jgi:hypothetical protein
MTDEAGAARSVKLDGFAVVAGVSRYQRIRSLPDVSDASDVAGVLRDPTLCGYPAGQVDVLVEEQATRTAILDAIDRVARSAHEGSSVFVYFSGHGGQAAHGTTGDCYLMPFDGAWGTPDDLARTAISGTELSARLQRIDATRVTIVLDCCRAAGIAEPKGTADAAIDTRMTPWALAPLGHGRGRAVLAASRADGSSYSVEGRRNSVFTQYLLEGLRGAARGTGGVIRVCDLFDYVQQKVTAEFLDQRPVFKADLEENYPLALYRGGQPPPLTLPVARDGCAYDAFVSYRRVPPDRDWVEKVLVTGLEGRGLHLCLAHRDFRLGAPRIREMERAVEQSRYTVAVFSKQYLDGAIEEFQALLGQQQAVEGREPRFIPLMREDCLLPLGIRTTERLDVSEQEFEQATLDRLAQRLRELYRANFSA